MSLHVTGEANRWIVMKTAIIQPSVSEENAVHPGDMSQQYLSVYSVSVNNLK